MHRLWNFLASVKLSFFLLLILAAMSILGTVLPQKEHPSVYLNHFGQTKGNLILSLGLDDMYHSTWFLTLMAALGANLVVCSLDRLPKTLKIVKKDPEKDLKRTTRPDETIYLKGTHKDIIQKSESLLSSQIGKVHQAQEDGNTHVLFAQKGAWSRFGVYGVHFSILIIFLGSIVGSVFGFAGRVNVTQGQTIDSITLDNGKPHKLNFALKLDKFKVTFYKDHKGMPSEFRSDVTFIQNANPAQKNTLMVNHPAVFEGIDFYQASYGEAPVNVLLRYTKGEKTIPVTLKHRKWTKLPDGGKAGVMEYRKSISMGKMYHGPFARIAYMADDKTDPVVIPAFKGKKMPSKGPVEFEIVKSQSLPFSGFSVKYDPGVWFIWIGCGLMVIGFFVAFYTSHRKVWIRIIKQDENKCKVELSGSANKNRVGIKRLVLKMSQTLAREK